MTDAECLLTPSHFTYLGVCYVGDNAIIQLSAANDPAPVTFTVGTISTAPQVSVPSPGVVVLDILAGIVLLIVAWSQAGHERHHQCGEDIRD